MIDNLASWGPDSYFSLYSKSKYYQKLHILIGS